MLLWCQPFVLNSTCTRTVNVAHCSILDTRWSTRACDGRRRVAVASRILSQRMSSTVSYVYLYFVLKTLAISLCTSFTSRKTFMCSCVMGCHVLSEYKQYVIHVQKYICISVSSDYLLHFVHQPRATCTCRIRSCILQWQGGRLSCSISFPTQETATATTHIPGTDGFEARASQEPPLHPVNSIC